MQLHYLRPGLAWLHHDLGWYLIESDLGVVRDEDITAAILLIDRIENHHELWSHESLGEVRGFELFVRKLDVLLPAEDIESAVHIHCDLLIDELDEPDVDARLTPLAHDVLTQASTDTLRKTVVTFHLQVHRGDTIGSHEGPHPRGDHWFARFFGPGFPWAEQH